MIYLQHDTGRWSTEYTWSADDGMWGARVLHSFGSLAGEEDDRERNTSVGGEKRIDEEDAMEGGLRGRFSAGAEVNVSLKEKSAGGMSQFLTVIVPIMRIAARELKLTTDHFSFRYWLTIFHVTGSSSFQPARLPIGPMQPPTPPTAILNPMMGQISVAYAAQVSRDLSLCSTFRLQYVQL